MEPTILGPGEGEPAANGVSLIKAATPEVTLAEYRWPSGRPGPELHVHHTHADAFYVLDGTITMSAGAAAEEVVLGPGDFALAPPEVPHTFRNESGADALFLNIHAPDAGYADSLRGNREGFDQHPAPPGGERPASEVLVRRASGDEMVAFKAEVGDAIGSFALMETRVPPGFPGPVLHRHRATTDSFYVLEGVLTVTLEGGTHEAGPGSCALVPPGNVHTFSNPGEEPVRVLNLMAPADFEQYLREMLEKGPLSPEELAARYDFEPA